MRSGLPDVMVIFCRHPAVFVELKSVSGIASKAQKQIRSELLAVGCEWWMARSARAALTALHRSGVPFRRPWKPPELRPWEGPFDGSERTLPQHPAVAAYRREVNRRWREARRVQGFRPRRRSNARGDANAPGDGGSVSNGSVALFRHNNVSSGVEGEENNISHARESSRVRPIIPCCPVGELLHS